VSRSHEKEGKMNGWAEREFRGEGETLEDAFQDAARHASEHIAEELRDQGLDPEDPEEYRRRPLGLVSISFEPQPHNQWVRIYTVVAHGSG